MSGYDQPGVYVEELPPLSGPVPLVATAVPAFIGVARRGAGGPPQRVASLAAFRAAFGMAPASALAVVVTRRLAPGGGVLGVTADWHEPEPGLPELFLHHAVAEHFAQGGGPLWVCPLASLTVPGIAGALAALAEVPEVTLVAVPEAVRLPPADRAQVAHALLAASAAARNRFALMDVAGALPETAGGVPGGLIPAIAAFRAGLAGLDPGLLRQGAAYAPFLRTSQPLRTTAGRVRIARALDRLAQPGGRVVEAANPELEGRTLAQIDRMPGQGRLAAEIRALVATARAVLPPSAAMAGLYARMDAARGVWKAPAGTLAVLSGAVPVLPLDDAGQAEVDAGAAAGGAAVNMIRAFPGSGTLVWGARTLAVGDPEGRYVSTRRLVGAVGESLARALAPFALEPNSPQTWGRVRAMAYGFLDGLLRLGALAGQKATEAYFVRVGLGQTMTDLDLAEGRMIVEIGLAPVRPAEFVILRIVQRVGPD